jgi:hypothetical protein
VIWVDYWDLWDKATQPVSRDDSYYRYFIVSKDQSPGVSVIAREAYMIGEV